MLGHAGSIGAARMNPFALMFAQDEFSEMDFCQAARKFNPRALAAPAVGPDAVGFAFQAQATRSIKACSTPTAYDLQIGAEIEEYREVTSRSFTLACFSRHDSCFQY